MIIWLTFPVDVDDDQSMLNFLASLMHRYIQRTTHGKMSRIGAKAWWTAFKKCIINDKLLILGDDLTRVITDIFEDILDRMWTCKDRDTLTAIWKKIVSVAPACTQPFPIKSVPPWIPRRMRDLWMAYVHDRPHGGLLDHNQDAIVEALAVIGELGLIKWVDSKNVISPEVWFMNGFRFNIHWNEKIREWYVFKSIENWKTNQATPIRILNVSFWMTLILSDVGSRDDLASFVPVGSFPPTRETWLVHAFHRMYSLKYMSSVHNLHASLSSSTSPHIDHMIMRAISRSSGLKGRPLRWYLDTYITDHETLTTPFLVRNITMLMSIHRRLRGNEQAVASLRLLASANNWASGAHAVELEENDNLSRALLCLDAFLNNSTRLVKHWLPANVLPLISLIRDSNWHTKKLEPSLFMWCIRNSILDGDIKLHFNVVKFQRVHWITDP